MNWRSSALALCMVFFGWSQAAAATYTYLVDIDYGFESITGFIQTNTNNSIALSKSNIVAWNLSVSFKSNSIADISPYTLSNRNSHVSDRRGGNPLFTATPTGLYFDPADTNTPNIDRSKYNLTFQSDTTEDAIQIAWLSFFPPTPCCAAWDLTVTGPLINCPSNLGGPCSPYASSSFGICSYPTFQPCTLFQIARYYGPTDYKVWWRQGWRHCWINRWGRRVCRW